MTAEERRKAISAGIRGRLRAEEGDPPRRGFRADLARATTLSTAHVSNFLNGKADVDQDAATKIAVGWWKRTMREVEDDVLGPGTAVAAPIAHVPARTVVRDAPFDPFESSDRTFAAFADGQLLAARDEAERQWLRRALIWANEKLQTTEFALAGDHGREVYEWLLKAGLHYVRGDAHPGPRPGKVIVPEVRKTAAESEQAGIDADAALEAEAKRLAEEAEAKASKKQVKLRTEKSGS